MKITAINSYSTIFTYDEIENFETSAFLIEKDKFYLIDTYCGPQSMQPILEVIKNSNPPKEVVVINTHFHWDHVWGNCSFAKSNIIAHELCRCKMDEVWESQIQRNEKYVMGEIVKQLPNITFSEKLTFLQEGIELFHSPGHTKDCISIFDH
ncbi:MAG: MBL fold metallo-hydrolase, partial [Vallitaleaceae bacterium]|nr:MBL fold metallo-hydrolase [Vallitaleaceae bacterium]